ncbi:MAG: DUF1161 domain-containing protein [Pseudomonas sp.]|jgi:hypothetical protein|uniref:DUF1161 domain-containing protein n=1 Tax=Pseudomonas sp. TaxID=306 RepID=UPI0027179CEA|nr:DUF1161 domain-containing protein [Pseudomonas sp.]
MHLRLSVLALMLFSTPLLAAPKDCEQLKREIEIKIQAAGVSSYTLEIVASADATDPGMVVGSCAYGSKKIVYQKND